VSQYDVSSCSETFFFLKQLKIAEGLGGPLNDISACYFIIVMYCAIGAKDENKDISTVLILFHKCLGTFLLVYVFYSLSLMTFFFCNPSCSVDHLKEAHGLLEIHEPHFGNL
jgi:hypothetical protein